MAANRWIPAQLGRAPFAAPPPGDGPAAGNLALAFATFLAERCDAYVNLTLLAAPGARIEDFLPADTRARHGWTVPPPTDGIAGQVFAPDGAARRSLNVAAAAAFDAVLIHMEETDQDADGGALAKLRALTAALSGSGLTDRDSRIMIGPPRLDAALSGGAAGPELGDSLIGVVAAPTSRGAPMARRARGSADPMTRWGRQYFDAYARLAPACQALAPAPESLTNFIGSQ